MHLYTLWFGCTTSTSREDNVWKLSFWPLRPCSWAPMGDQVHLLYKWHVPFHMNDYYFEFCIWNIWLCIFYKRKHHFSFWGPSSIFTPPPPFPPGLSGVVLDIDINILYYLQVKCIKENVICQPKYFWIKNRRFCKKYLVLALRTLPMGPMWVISTIWRNLNPLPLKMKTDSNSSLEPLS